MPDRADDVVIKVRAGGPYKVTGPVTITDADGNPIAPPDDGPIVLCRCGRSQTKPFCDRSHRCEAAGGGTLAVHAGLPAAQDGEPYLPGPVFAAPYHLRGDADVSRYGYQREANPTWDLYEAALGELEGAGTAAFASGMAAVSAVVLSLLSPGDVLVAPSDGYYTLRQITERHLAPRGVEVRLVPTSDAAIREALPGATLVWIESPSNPLLDVVDIAGLTAAAHAAGAVVAVDNTLATPLRQRPLDLGADYSVGSAAKQLSGHSDLVLGYVAATDPERLAAVRTWRTMTGAIPGPFETWLAHRSLATMGVRVERQESTAAALADALQARGDVRGVRWPGVGCVVAFDLESEARAQAFFAATRLVAEATSFGGVHSSAERRARWGADDVSPGLIRFSVGIEDTADVLADVMQALDAAP